MNITHLFVINFLGLVSVASVATAASCEEYPYTNGINSESVAGGTKIISTASASVSFDDIDALNQARDEATLEAKTYISKILSEVIISEQNSSTATSDVKNLKGDTKEAILKVVKESIKKNGNSTQALVRGILPLGDCYTKGREVRVSVGIKPETISQAESLSNGIRNSLNAQPTPTTSNTGGGSGQSGNPVPSPKTSGGMQGSEGFSNTTRLQNF